MQNDVAPDAFCSLLSKEKGVQECDATKLNFYSKAGFKKLFLFYTSQIEIAFLAMLLYPVLRV